MRIARGRSAVSDEPAGDPERGPSGLPNEATRIGTADLHYTLPNNNSQLGLCMKWSVMPKKMDPVPGKKRTGNRR